MEENFGINNVALVEGQPRTMGLKELLKVYVDFRTDVVRRRTEHRLAQARGAPAPRRGPAHRDRRHRRGHPGHPHLRRRRASPRARLMDVFDLIETQATYILDLQLRRLTKFSRLELENEKSELERAIEELRALLDDEKLLLKLVSDRARRRGQGARHAPPHRAARELGASATATAALARSRSPTTRAGCCFARPACSRAPGRPSRVTGRGLALQARRRHRCGAHHGPWRVRPRHERRPDDAALGARPADAAADERRAQPVRRRAARGLRRPAARARSR